MKFLLEFLILLIVYLTIVDATSRCSVVCMNNLQCRAGSCVLTKCSDTTSCLEYCFDCFGTESCYATGSSCSEESKIELRQAIISTNKASGMKNSFWHSFHLLGFVSIVISLL